MTTPQSDVHFLEIDEGGVLFHERRQRFYGLNATAALCWAVLSEGLPESAALAELAAAGAPEADALDWLRSSIEIFRTEGFLEPAGDGSADPPLLNDAGPAAGQRLERIPPCALYRRWRLFDVMIRVGFTTNALLPRVAGMLARVAQPAEGSADIEITVIEVGGRILVARDGLVVGVAPDAAGLAALLEPAMLRRAIDATPHLLALHAGVAARNGCGLVLPGPSGSGKTTLIAALAASGWTYGTDETTLLAADGKELRMAPLSACVKEGSWPLLVQHYPSLLDEPIQERGGRRVRYLPPPGPAIERCRATHVVFPRRTESGTRLRPIGRIEGIERLLAECVSIPQRLGLPEAVRLVDWTRGLSFHELAFADLPGALAALQVLGDSKS
ncbi:MAG TPA: hypothetical protein VN821_14780 [Candidatus Udaeobacter sp.]|nr:hypothetical protein [Candidatus Udaeobacter sp.]